MALESVSAAETVIQSNDDNDLEDGEIPSDEDDEPVHVAEPPKPAPEPPKPPPGKTDSPKHKSFDNKFGKNKKSGSVDRLNRQKGPSSDDWAGDVEKAIRAALEEDRGKNHDNKSRNKSNKNKNRKRNREEKDDERSRDQKKKKLSDEENANEDDDEMLFVRGASPVRKGSHEHSSPRRGDHDNYNSGSDYDDRSVTNRHRDDNKRGGGRWAQAKQQQQERNKKLSIAAGRRGTKNERGGKNKSRAQLRNDRNSRRNQVNDHNQDPDAICVYYMQGKCHRGDDCPFSHNALPPRKMELCKFYLMDCCAKRDKCLYMHHDFPCKFFHTGLKCNAGENCKFSHQPMSEQVKSILLKHLETAPKEILGNFPRLSREGAMYLINNTEKNLAQGQDASNQKIPSLFELKVPTPNDNIPGESGKDEGDDQLSNRDKSSLSHKDRKSSSGKKTRWGSDEDRVPYDMLVQSATQLGLHITNNQDKTPAGGTTPVNFYSEGGPNDFTKKEKEVKEEPAKAKDTPAKTLNALPKDVDLRQLLAVNAAPKVPQVVSLAEEAASLTKSKLDEESDRDEMESDLVIEMPTDDEDKEKDKNKTQEIQDTQSNSSDKPKNSTASVNQEIPANLPKKTQELYMRIQQQQREAEDSFKNLENTEDQTLGQEDWYSDDDNDDDDDDDDDQLTIVLKDIQKEEEEEEEEKSEPKEELIPQPASIPQPAAIVDKLGDLSKIDISMEVSKLLSSIKAQSSSNNLKQEKDAAAKARKEASLSSVHVDVAKPSAPEIASQFSKTDSGSSSPRLSPSRTSGSSAQAQATGASRDPRMSRDPRQRRDERLSSHGSGSGNPTIAKPENKESRSLRLETSIYSSGIIAQDATMDTDLRAKLDQDHRRKDMDLRCFPHTPSFGDTDLRLVGGHYPDSTKSGDVDLRQILSLPFKPVPSHVPCTEIEASITSHPPIPYKVYVVDVPRPDYTGLKLTRNDPQVKYDPRLRKIFRLGKDDLADSPMSPPPVKMLDTPKSPPLVRTDPRRKALEAHPAPKIIPTTVQQHPVQEHPIPGMPMGMGPPYMQGPGPANMPVQVMQGMGPPPMMMQGNPMMMQGNPMIRDGNPMIRDGNPMIRDGNPMIRDGNPMIRDGNPMIRDGNPMIRDGNPMIRDGNPMIRDGNPMIRDGNPMIRDGPGMPQNPGGPMPPGNMRMGNMGPPGPNHQPQHPGPPPSQMNQYDPRYNAQRNSGVGLLGAGPPHGYSQDGRPQYDGPPGRYPPDGFNNYPPNSDRPDPRGFNPNGQVDEPNFVGNQPDWNGGPARPNRKDRRRATRGKFGGLPRKKDNGPS